MQNTILPALVVVAVLIAAACSRHIIHALQVDPKVQYNFHRVMSFFWLTNMGAVLFIPALHPNAADLFIIEASLYANFATEFGAMSAALAAMRDDGTGRKLAQNQEQLKANDAWLLQEVHAMFDPAVQ